MERPGSCSSGHPSLSIASLLARDVTASFLAVRPTQTFHVVTMHDGGEVRSIQPLEDSGIWINGGYFVFRRSIFDHIRRGEDLVVLVRPQPQHRPSIRVFDRLADSARLPRRRRAPRREERDESERSHDENREQQPARQTPR